MKDRNKDRALHRAVLCICLVALAAGATLLLLFWLGSRGPKKAEALDGVEMESYFEDGENASIAVHYPKTGRNPVDVQVLRYIDETLAAFRSKVGQSSANRHNELNVSFDVYRYSPQIISFKFNAYSYTAADGGAAASLRTMTFNLDTDAQYALEDLFGGENYLQTLSEKAAAALADSGAQAGLTQLAAQLSPAPENFRYFVLDGPNLRLFFPSLRTDGAAGPTESVSIPLAELDAVLADPFRTQADETPEPPAPEKPSVPPAQPEDDPCKVLTDTGLADKKLVALTFDDGPNPDTTSQLLDILKQEQVHATFFVLGSRAQYYPELVRRAADEGHQIGTHTYGHKQLTKLTDKERRDEIERANEAIENAVGALPTALRPPYGSYNDDVKADAHMPVVMWSVDPEDWKYRDADTVCEHIVSAVKDGDIVLLHDIYQSSVEGAQKAIQALKADGYTFVTVEQLLNARGEAESGEVYSAMHR